MIKVTLTKREAGTIWNALAMHHEAIKGWRATAGSPSQKRRLTTARKANYKLLCQFHKLYHGG